MAEHEITQYDDILTQLEFLSPTKSDSSDDKICGLVQTLTSHDNTDAVSMIH